jgi:hypothetical protein
VYISNLLVLQINVVSVFLLGGLHLKCAGRANKILKMEIEMRELTLSEMNIVSGAGDDCSGGNSFGGVTEPSSLGADLTAAYEGLVAVTSHIIERVANAL